MRLSSVKELDPFFEISDKTANKNTKTSSRPGIEPSLQGWEQLVSSLDVGTGSYMKIKNLNK